MSNYRNGNFSDVTKLAAQRFITIIPIAPAVRVDDTSKPNKHYLPDVSAISIPGLVTTKIWLELIMFFIFYFYSTSIMLFHKLRSSIL